MIIGTCRVQLCFPGVQSLKEKRRILKGALQKTRNKYNVSIAEVGYQDKWQRASIAIVSVSNDARYLQRVMEKVVAQLDSLQEGYILDYDIEII